MVVSLPQQLSRDFLKETATLGSGIGRASALLLAKEGAAAIMIADLALDAAKNVVAECQAVASNSQMRTEAVQVDVTREDSVRNLVKRMVNGFGRIDYCVNCAGVSSPDRW